MLDNPISREGVMVIQGGIVHIDGFRMQDGGMCREVAAAACLYMARRLLEIGLATIASHEDQRCVIGLPDGTPADWWCNESRMFMDPLFEPESPDGSEYEDRSAQPQDGG